MAKTDGRGGSRTAEPGTTHTGGARSHLLLERGEQTPIRTVKWWHKWNDQPVWFDRLAILVAVGVAFGVGHLAGSARRTVRDVDLMAEAREVLMTSGTFASQCVRQLVQQVRE